LGERRTARPAAGSERQALALAACAALALVLPLSAAEAASAVDAAAVGTGIAGAAAAGAVLLREGLPGGLRVRGAAIAGAAFIAWSVLCALLSGRGWSAFVGEPTNMLGALTLICLSAVALAGATLGERLRRVLVRGALTVVGLQTALAVFQLAASKDVRGFLPNSTYLGEIVVLLLPMLLLERAAPWRQAGLVLAPTAALVLAAGGSRVAAVAALIWLLVVWAANAARSRRSVLIVRAAALAATAGAALAFSGGEVLSTLGASALGERPLMWQASAWAVARRPVFGYGPDGFVAAAASVLDLDRLARGVHLAVGPGSADPHSALAWVAVSGGLVGVALFAALVAAVVRAWRAPGRPPFVVASSWGVAMAFAVFLTAPAALQALPVFALVLGVSLSGGDERVFQRSGRADGIWFRVAACAAAAASLLLAANAAARMPLEVASAERSPALARPAMRAAEVWRFDAHLWRLASLHAGWAVREKAGGVEPMADLAAARRAASLDRRDPWYALEAARTLAFYRAPAAEVEAAFEEAFRRWPAFPLARAERALWLATNGRRQDAEREVSLVRDAADHDPALAAAIHAAEAAIGR